MREIFHLLTVDEPKKTLAQLKQEYHASLPQKRLLSEHKLRLDKPLMKDVIRAAKLMGTTKGAFIRYAVLSLAYSVLEANDAQINSDDDRAAS